MKVDLRLGDCIEVLKTIPDNSIDSVVTDPPYHLTSIVKRFGKEDSAPAQFGTDGAYARASRGFMGKEWDGGDIAFRTDVWEECLRILKPGGHLLAFSHSRTYHRMGVAIEDAGFEIRDQIMWVYGQGFPKSQNIGKAVDKIQGNKREVVGEMRAGQTALGQNSGWNQHENKTEIEITKGNSEWEGWGTALKPAHEPIVMARKPLSEKSIVQNVLKHGTGGINIDGSRIEIKEGDGTSAGHRTCNIFETEKISGGNGSPDYETHEGGRFPANIIFDEEAGKLLDQQSGPTSQGHWSKTKTKGYGKFGDGDSTYEGVGHKDKNTDKGGASRFFYCPKTSKKDRNEGDVSNLHPTVKPTDLMRYLINLVTPPNGTTLDPFMGSGSTGKAAIRCGVNFIGIEKEQEYMDIAKARIEYEQNKPVQQSLF